MRKSKARRGYEPIATQVLDEGAPPDLKESFYLGRDLGPEHAYVRAGLHGYGANQWPESLSGFRAQMEAYFDALSELSLGMMRLLALSLDLPQGYFDAMMREPMPVLRLIHYPAHPADARPNQLGAGAHTDWGALTVLLQDDCGGLEVRNAAGDWIRANPIPGTFVINLGDMMRRWTDDLYQSTLHRVLNNVSGRDRYSIATFCGPHESYRVECLPTCRPVDRAPHYAPCTAGEHTRQMAAKTYAMAAN
jgi:isopenicillin N synthase-like dioxygenase